MNFFPVDTAMAFLTDQPLHPSDNAEVMKSQTDSMGEQERGFWSQPGEHGYNKP